MTTTLDQLAVRHPNVPSDRRPSLNTQAAIDAYDYRFAAWEVIDGADIREVCRRLDVPGGPTVLGPKVVALRARLADCAKVGRPPPERPTTPPLSPLAKGAGAAAPLDVAWRERPRPGMALDATANPSAKKVTGRALVTRAADTQDDDQPQRPSTPAPWREALTLKVSAAAVRTVAKQEGSDPVKALRAAGFAQEAEALQAELRAAAATPPPSAAPPAVPTSTEAALVEVEDVLADAPASVYDVEGRWPRHVRTYTAIAGNGEDIPASAELAAEAAADETLWEQTHSEETVRAAQAEHARQRALLHDLSEQDREDEEIAAASDAAPPAPPAVLPVARGRSTKTLEASAQTPVVKAPLRGRSAPPPVAPPAASAAAAQALPLPKWPAKAPVVVSDPPPKRDRSKNRQAAPKPPPPAQVVLLGMSPATTTSTNIGRPKRRSVAATTPAPPPVVKVPKAKAPRAPKAVAASKAKMPQPERPKPATATDGELRTLVMRRFIGPEALRVEVERALDLLLTSRAGIRGKRQHALGTFASERKMLAEAAKQIHQEDYSPSHSKEILRRHKTTEQTLDAVINISERRELIQANRAALLACPAAPKANGAAWRKHIHAVVAGNITYQEFAKLCGISASLLSLQFQKHGVRRDLLPEGESRRGMRAAQTKKSTNFTTDLGLWFGLTLREFRTFYALKQPELAMALDIPTSKVTSMEQGRYEPCAEVVTRAARYFETTWRELLPADDDATRLRRLVDGALSKRLAWSCADILRHIALPCVGVVPPPPGRRRTGHPLHSVEDLFEEAVRGGMAARRRGWALNALEPNQGALLTARLKMRVAELREEMDNLGHALGLPARAWNPGDPETCDIDLTDAEHAALKADDAKVAP